MCMRVHVYSQIHLDAYKCMHVQISVHSLLLYLSALPQICPVPSNGTVAILAQGTNRADAVTQAF